MATALAPPEMDLELTLSLLQALDSVALGALGFERMVEGLVAILGRLLGAELCGLMVWEPAREVLQLVPGSFGAPAEQTASYQVSGSDTASNAARVFTSGRPHVSNAARDDRGILQDYVEAFGIRRLISVPLQVADRPTGVLHFANKPEPFTDADLRVVRFFAPRIGIAVEHIRDMLRIRRKEALEAVLSRVAEAIASGVTINGFLSFAFDDFLMITGAQCVALSVDGAEPVLLRRGVTSPQREPEFLAASRRGGARVRDELSRPGCAGDPGAASIHVPVVIANRPVATLSLLRLRAEPLSGDERGALERLASLAALAWATERYQQERAGMARLRERERIADDLHDHVAQILFSSKLPLEALLEDPSLDGPAHAKVVMARDLLVRGETAIRDLISSLSHPHHLPEPIAQRLVRVIQEVEEQFGIAIHLETRLDPVAVSEAHSSVGDLLVRVCREGLVNAAKHAGPSKVSVMVQVDSGGRWLLTIEDDGLGLPESGTCAGHGLRALRRAMDEHGGTLSLSRLPHGGTRLAASIGS